MSMFQKSLRSYCGRSGESRIVSSFYPYLTRKLVNEITKKVKTSCYLTTPVSLIPVYENEYMKLGLHHDRFRGKPEYVINCYFGDERQLYVESDDKTYSTKLRCKQGFIRIFHPIFNVLFKHEKRRSHIKRKVHYALSIREGQPRQSITSV